VTPAKATGGEELSERVLGIIGTYGMGAALDPRHLYTKTPPDVSAQTVRPGPEGYVQDGVYHVAHLSRVY
jgi:hypothetical protein